MAKPNNNRRYKNNNRKITNQSKQNNANMSSLEYQQFASTSAVFGSSTSNASSTNLTETRTKSMINDPSKNATQLANSSYAFSNLNGLYKSVLKYLSSSLTFDHLIYPVFDNPIEAINMQQDIQVSFAQTSIFVDGLNIKYYLPIFTYKVMTKGAVFLFKSEDSKGIAYNEFPTAYCRVSYMEDGVYRYQLDMSKLTAILVESYPKEIQSAYNQYSSGSRDKFIEGKWYQVSDKGVAFSLDTEVLANAGMSLPPLANSIIDIIKYENAKASMEDAYELDNSKIVHSKIATDDRGRPLMEKTVVDEFHKAIKNALPKGSVALTNPFETEALSLTGVGNNQKFSLLDKTSEQFHKSTGVSPMLFSNESESSQALERSIDVDNNWLYSFVLPMFTNYFNYELKKVNKKSTRWKIKFLASSYFKKEEAIKNAKDQLTYGGSRLEYLATCGLSPLEVANMLTFEQNILDIDSLMVAKQTSNTLSGDSAKTDEGGRPKSANPTDTTVRINDSK